MTEQSPRSAYQQFGERAGQPNPNWQSVARTYRIETTAQIFGIPERSWNHPTVHSFVEATLDARDLQTSLTIDSAQNSFVAQWNYALHRSENTTPPGAPGMNPPLSVRYGDGRLLLSGVTEILEYGLEGISANLSDYIAGKIGLVTERLGVMVTGLSETEPPEAPTPVVVPRSAWSGGAQPDLYHLYAARYGLENVKLWGMSTVLQSRITNQTEEQIRLRALATASRLGIPTQSLDHPTVAEFVHNLHRIEDLLNILEQGEAPPGAPGITPSVDNRYAMGAHLLTVAKAIMEEGFQGRNVPPQFVANHVNSAVSYFGLQARLQIQG